MSEQPTLPFDDDELEDFEPLPFEDEGKPDE